MTGAASAAMPHKPPVLIRQVPAQDHGAVTFEGAMPLFRHAVHANEDGGLASMATAGQRISKSASRSGASTRTRHDQCRLGASHLHGADVVDALGKESRPGSVSTRARAVDFKVRRMLAIGPELRQCSFIASSVFHAFPSKILGLAIRFAQRLPPSIYPCLPGWGTGHRQCRQSYW